MAATRWRAPEDARGRTPAAGLIGPNAILQYLPVLARTEGEDGLRQLLARAGLFDLPDGETMIDEGDAARLHRQVRVDEPDLAPLLAAEAGTRTGDYILAHRIPAPVRTVLRHLPAPLAARLLSGAIARHAWTFAGSGRFRAVDAWTFEIAANPIIRGERSDRCLCDWHAAVFGRLYSALVHPDCLATETDCCAKGPGHVCRFEVGRDRS